MTRNKTIFAVALLASCAASASAVGQSDEASMKTLYDRGESALEFQQTSRAGASVRFARPAGAQPPAAFASAQSVEVAPTTSGSEWWAAHEAIRLGAQDR